jgi:hypothetical protein
LIYVFGGGGWEEEKLKKWKNFSKRIEKLTQKRAREIYLWSGVVDENILRPPNLKPDRVLLQYYRRKKLTYEHILWSRAQKPKSIRGYKIISNKLIKEEILRDEIKTQKKWHVMC